MLTRPTRSGGTHRGRALSAADPARAERCGTSRSSPAATASSRGRPRTPTARSCSATCSAAACTASTARRGHHARPETPRCRRDRAARRRRRRVFGTRHRPRAGRRHAHAVLRFRGCRAGTTSAPTPRAASTRARCASRSSIPTRSRCPASATGSTRKATRSSLYGGVLHANGIALSPGRQDDLPLRHARGRDLRARSRPRRQRHRAAHLGDGGRAARRARGGRAGRRLGRVRGRRPRRSLSARWPRRAQPRGAGADRHERVLRGPRPLRPDRHHRGPRASSPSCAAACCARASTSRVRRCFPARI